MPVRLACIKRTASVRPEPGSNSKRVFPSTIQLLRCRRQIAVTTILHPPKPPCQPFIQPILRIRPNPAAKPLKCLQAYDTIAAGEAPPPNMPCLTQPRRRRPPPSASAKWLTAITPLTPTARRTNRYGASSKPTRRPPRALGNQGRPRARNQHADLAIHRFRRRAGRRGNRRTGLANQALGISPKSDFPRPIASKSLLYYPTIYILHQPLDIHMGAP